VGTGYVSPARSAVNTYAVTASSPLIVILVFAAVVISMALRDQMWRRRLLNKALIEHHPHTGKLVWISDGKDL
jgi:hypothetical protein